MKKLVTALFAAVALVAYATPGLAAPSAQPKMKVFNLLGSEIEGTLIQPNGGWIHAKPKVVHTSLIEYRLNFNPEMLKSTEQL